MIPVIIPARLKSSRFPSKPLAMVSGKTLVQRVCELASKAVGVENVYVATEANEISDHVQALGFKSVITSESCPTGTDRVAEAMRILHLESAINVQGDEPLLNPLLISLVAETLESSQAVVNVSSRLMQHDNPASLSLPKVVEDRDQNLLYASRAAIPLGKSGLPEANRVRKQVCVYGLRLNHLEFFGPEAQKTPNEEVEDIEILRFLESGQIVKMVHFDAISAAVDHPSDIELVENLLRQAQNDQFSF